jgi:membrane glycosyltransferase
VLSFVAALVAARNQPYAGVVEDSAEPPWALGLFVVTMTMLLLPKLWSYLLLVRDRQQRLACGGAAKAAASVALETVVSMLVAPILMAFHANFVAATFSGRRVEWTAQPRGEEGVRLSAAISAHWKQTVAGIVAAGAIWMLASSMFVWFLPVLVGLLLAIPLSLSLSSVRLGRAVARRGWLATPEETSMPMIFRRYRHFLALAPLKELADTSGMFRRVLADPAFLALHCCILQATEAVVPADPRQIRLAERQLLAGGPHHVSAENRKAILGDPAAVAALHLFAWTSTRKGDAQRVEAHA